MWRSYAETWMEIQRFMNSYSVFAQTMTFWLSCFPCVSTPGTCSSVCWSTRCVWGSEASPRGRLLGFVSMDWPSVYASQSMRQLGQRCSRSHIHRLSKCLLMRVCAFCLPAAVSIFQEPLDVKAWIFPSPQHVVLLRENAAVLVWPVSSQRNVSFFYLHLFPGQSHSHPWPPASPLARAVDKMTSHFTGDDPSIQSSL